MDHRIIQLPKILDERGNLSFLQKNEQIPFTIQRVYWIYDVPGGERRGGHAYEKQHELIIALSGSFEVVMFDGRKEERIVLNRSYYGLYVPPMIWRHMENFSTNSVAFVVTDRSFDENDYIRDVNVFKAKIQ